MSQAHDEAARHAEVIAAHEGAAEHEGAARLRLAIDMFEAGVEMHRLSLQRRHPDHTADDIDVLLRAWLLDRPGAPAGDAVGRVRNAPPRACS